MGISTRTSNTQEGSVLGIDTSTSRVSSSSSSSISTMNNNKQKKWSNLMPILIALVVIVEIGFLGRLDMAKNAAMVHTWTKSFYFSSMGGESFKSESREDLPELGFERNNSNSQQKSTHSRDVENCEAWLEREDAIPYSRNFHENPIWVSGSDESEEWDSCSVGCKLGYKPDTKRNSDGVLGLPKDGVVGILRSMESSHYYSENNVDLARRRGFKVVMTTSLSSDVPVGYFSWAEYDIMAPLQPKTESAIAAAFISNCGARNFRLQALEMLEKSNIKIDSYGSCHRNRDGRVVDKVDALKHYKFSLAFENSNEEDYVTEKFFQSLVAGTVPVVVGAPNIMDFAPAPGSVLHIKELDDVPMVAKSMKYLAENADAYNQSIRWKYDGPSDSFKALVDLAAVHSSCRLCIHLATTIRETEENRLDLKKRPCKCSRGLETVYHLYVRERGRFEMESIFLRGGDMTLEALESSVLAKFKSLNHEPVWKQERPERIRGEGELKVYKIYPFGLTQRQALYSFQFKDDADFRSHVERNPCSKFEVIFV